MNKELNNNAKSVFVRNGASNHSEGEREIDDFYATEPKAIDVLLCEGGVVFNEPVLECACGKGHLSEAIKRYGYEVVSRDLIDRGYGISGIDFLATTEKWNGDIVTNPPYKYAQKFVEHAIEIVEDGCCVFMFLKLTFLESKARKELFNKYPPKYIWVSSSRLQCAKNGDFETYGKGVGTAVAYAWYQWEKGYKGETVIKWIN